MKKAATLLTLFWCLLATAPVSLGHEGMWLPLLLEMLNEDDMKTMGMRISAKDIYNVNQASLKDAIVSFGGYCTGEVIGNEGLLLTNHHCGFSSIQRHSSVENDLLANGFWAMTKDGELANPNLFATFLVRMEDVTEAVLGGLSPSLAEEQRQAAIEERTAALIQAVQSKEGYDATIKPFFYGNEYYMFITETYNDVRLVGAPPSSIGKFGGDTDNWVWPRHTGDFSLFRIYQSAEGGPAPYSVDNVPYKPRKFLPIYMGGVKPGDFTMVFGFPGSTQEYLSSHAVDYLINTTNPHRIALRSTKLNIINQAMQSSNALRIMYATQQAGVANYWKKWEGETQGLRRMNATQRKQAQEQQFYNWLKANPERESAYGHVNAQFEQVYQKRHQVELANTYYREAILRTRVFRICMELAELTDKRVARSVPAERYQNLKSQVMAFYTDWHAPTEAQITTAMLQAHAANVPSQLLPPALASANLPSLVAEGSLVYPKTMEALMDAFIENPTKASKALAAQPLMQLFMALDKTHQELVAPTMKATNLELALLQRTYLKGLREMQPNKAMYPDANRTMRVSFGKVEGFEPQDGLAYLHQTTLDGVLDKENPDSYEFAVPAKLKALYQAKDFGPYVNAKGQVPVAFLASNHTTGGNSGSPVINADGYIVGLNFDRNWEGTMSDIMYDPARCRNISLDIRYVLFLIDKYAGAGHLLQEMQLVYPQGHPMAQPAGNTENKK